LRPAGLIVVLLVGLAGTSVSARPVLKKAAFRQSPVAPGGEAVLVVEVSGSPNDPVTVLPPPGPPRARNLEYLGRSTEAVTRPSPDGAGLLLRFLFRWRAGEEGSGEVEGFDLALESAPGVPAGVLAVPAAGVEIRSPEKIPAWGWAAAAAFLVLGLLYARWQVRRFRREAEELVEDVTSRYAREARAAAAAAARCRMEGRLDEWAGILEEVLSRYLRQRYCLTPEDVAGEDIRFHGRLEGYPARAAGDLFRILRSVRYGGGFPDGVTPSEVEKGLDRFLRETSGG